MEEIEFQKALEDKDKEIANLSKTVGNLENQMQVSKAIEDGEDSTNSHSVIFSEDTTKFEKPLDILKRTILRTKDAKGKVTNEEANGYLKNNKPVEINLTDSQKWDLYFNCDALFGIVNRVIEDVTTVEPKFVPRDPSAKIDKKLKKKINQIQEFFDTANELKESFRQMRKKALLDRFIIGRCVYENVYKGKNVKVGNLQEIRVLPASSVIKNVNNRGEFENKDRAYIQNPDAKEPIYFNKNQITMIIDNPVSYLHYGISKLDALANTIASDMLKSTVNSNYFINGGHMSGILTLEGLNKQQLKQYEKLFKDKFQGAENAHKLGITNVKAAFVKLIEGIKDMEFLEYGRYLLSRMILVFGIQPMILGIVDQSTGRLNSELQYQLYKNNALKPILKDEEHFYTQDFIKNGLGIDDIKMDFSGVDLLDQKNQSLIDNTYVTSGIIAVNEIRARMSLPPREGGDSLLPAPGTVPIGGGAGNVDNSPNTPSSDNAKKKTLADKLDLYKDTVVNKLEVYFTSGIFNKLSDFMQECQFEKRAETKNYKIFTAEVNKFPKKINDGNEELNALDNVIGFEYLNVLENGLIIEEMFKVIQNKIKYCILDSAKLNLDYAIAATRIEKIFDKPIDIHPDYLKNDDWLQSLMDVSDLVKE